jgi:hypothetical protein
VRLGHPLHHDTKRLGTCQHKDRQKRPPNVLTRTADNTDSDGVAKEGLVYDLLYSSATA